MGHKLYNSVLAFRVTDTDRKKFEKTCNAMQMTKSDLLREACITMVKNVHGDPDVLRTNKTSDEPGIERN